MKKYLINFALLFSAFLFVTTTNAQENQFAGQNPNFAVSREKYMRIADSVNQWHGTTFQETYKAFDWYEQKMERRDQRIEFRRQLRLERARGYDRYYYNRYDPYRYNNYWTPGHRNHFWWY